MTAMTITVLSSFPKLVVAAAATYQADPRALIEGAGLDPNALDSPNARIPLAMSERLWGRAVAMTGDPCLGLVAAQHATVTSFHAMGFAWLASPSLNDVLRRLLRYERLLASTEWVVLEKKRGRTALTLMQPTDMETASSCRADLSFAVFLRWVQHLLSDPELAPAEVEFRHGDHGQRNRYEALFKAPLTFNAAVDRLWFDDAVLERALPGDNPVLAAEADRIADAYLAGLADEPTTHKVRALLIDLLPQGQADLQNVAQRLFMSLRSLQRHLGEEGHTFRGLLEETRKALAMEYVRDGKQPLSEVAFLLGFSDQSAFSKAFKRWTKMSPVSYAASAGGQ